MTNGCQSKKVRSAGFYEEGVKVAEEAVENMREVIDATPAASGALQLEPN